MNEVPETTQYDVNLPKPRTRKVLAHPDRTGYLYVLDRQTGEYESRLQTSLQSMLDRLVGVGNAVVTVNADLSYDQTVRTTQTQKTDPTLPPVSATKANEKYTGAAGAASGVLGPDNIAVPSGASGSGDYTSESSTVNNPVDTTTEQLTTAPGSVKRQSVSVVVSDAAAGTVNLGDLQTAVAAAAGIDAQRGDVVSVTKMSFDTTAAEQAKEALAAADKQAQAEQTAGLIKTGGIGGGILLALIVAVVLGLRASRNARREALDVGELELIEMRKAEALEAAAAARALPSAEPIQHDPANTRRDDVMALAAEQPAEVAEVLRGWLVGGRR